MSAHLHGCTCFIIPSKMLRKLAEQTHDVSERRCLLDAAEISAHLRGQRSVAPMVLGIATAVAGEKSRNVYDAKNKSALPGKLARAEDSKPSTDTAVNQAYDGAGATYDFYREVLKRNSIDGKG